MRFTYYIVWGIILLFWSLPIKSQRTYQSNSVLATGEWYKFAINGEGIYKVDVAFLSSLGIIQNNIPSASIRLYGNGGQMLEENNAVPRTDDLRENAIQVFDGGDGIFNNSDYFLFYASGPDKWLKDSVNARFKHQKNIYSDQCYFYISIGGNGLRVNTIPALTPTITINTYNARYFHELDTVNFLSSGKEWYGEEFANMPGKTITRNFPVSIPGLAVSSPVLFISSVVSRSTGAFSRFDVSANNNLILQHDIAYTGTAPSDPFGVVNEQRASFINSQASLDISYKYTPGSLNAQGWLNWFEIYTRASLTMDATQQFLFRDWQSVGSGNTGLFSLKNANSSIQVWDITNPANPQKMSAILNGSDLQFSNTCNAIHEYIAFTGTGFLLPTVIGKINNQNLHNSSIADLLIVSYPGFLSQATRLAAHHTQKDNLRCVVASTDQVFNEFSSGSPDPTAIRDFAKMYYDKAGGDSSKMPKYLLLFGDASFDFKNRITNNTNLVPCYENNVSLDPLASYTSDDFFGFLHDDDDINNPGHLNLLSIGIGRIPANTVSAARDYADKVMAYTTKESFGTWRNELSFIADDGDGNLHLQDAESITTTVSNIAPVFNQAKIYLDAYKQQSGSGGSSYPDANTAINNKIYTGNLIWNYNGHGNYRRLADEVILDQDIINGWNNPNKLPLFITATCDFAPYDNPLYNSIGEDLLLRPKTGAIALMTTTRLVFSYSNRIINNNYLQVALVPNSDGNYLSLGEATKRAKNFTYANYPDIINNRKFTLLGDPALTLGFPVNKVQTDSINGHYQSVIPDTLKALGKYTFSGRVKDAGGNFLNSFNGTVYPLIFDKPQTIYTLANEPGSFVTGFQSQNNVLYKGKAKVINGQFTFTFIVPKDINNQFGRGKISYYATDSIKDGNGASGNIIIGGINNNALDDKQGPIIKAWLNDEKFVNGGTSNESPVLLVRLSDSSGINTSGLGIGHNITAVLDNDNRKLFDLDGFYEADLDSYQSGKVSFQLPKLEAGYHTLKIKAWDVFNNSGEYILEFSVAKDDELSITHVLNYPNPFTTKTTFWFEHNHPGEDMQVNIRVFTVAGKLVKTFQKTINTQGNRSCDIEWDGRDDFGDRLGRGVYIYRILVGYKTKRTGIIEKLMLF